MLHILMETRLSVTLVFISCVTAVSWTDLAKYSIISTSQTCNTNGSDFSCNNTCKATDSSNSSYYKPLINATVVECSNGSNNSVSNVTLPKDGNITFGDDNCTTRASNTFNGISWTISFWANYNGNQTRPLLEVKNRSNNGTLVKINTNFSQIGNGSTARITIGTNLSFLVIRMTSKGALYIDIDNKTVQTGVTQIIPNATWITLGPDTDIFPDVIQIRDARMYSHCLTDREIMKLWNGKLEPILNLQNECMCPRDTPSIILDQQNYGIVCRDHTGYNDSRLNNATHPAEYAIDGDPKTYWNSGKTQSATITLNLKTVYQLSSVKIHFSEETTPSELQLSLMYKSKVSRNYTFRCTSSPSCDIPGGNLTFSMENETSVTNRTSYMTLLADTVVIRLNGNGSNKTFYAINEISITGSCHCSNTSGSCKIGIGTNYYCNCTNESNTFGTNCESCKSGFWREAADFACPKPCNCNLVGSLNNTCSETGGQCTCKSNVVGLRCDECAHNSYNLSINGCKRCNCNPTGIINCTSTGECNCKSNVERTSGTCNSCEEYFYGFYNSSGCTECNCNVNGTKGGNKTCNESLGQCDCKYSVAGRTCNVCDDKFHGFGTDLNGCKDCKCNFVVGSVDEICDKATGQCPCYNNTKTNPACDPEIDNPYMTPVFGPSIGGTVVTLSGQQLGQNETLVQVLMNNVNAMIIERNSTAIIFKTMGSEIGKVNATINWSIFKYGRYHHHEFLVPVEFEYRKNPSVYDPPTILRTFSSGLCNIELKGQALDSVYRPEIILYGIAGVPNINGICSHSSGDSTSIFCKPPNVSTLVTNGTYSYGVVLDGITDFLNMTSSVIEIQPDPIFHTNGEIVYRNVFDKLITVQGEGFRRACDKKDFRLHLSKRGDCEIKDITDTEISCDPKETFPGTGEKEALKIYIGVLEKDIGTVEFRTFWKLQEFIYICIGVGAFVLIVVITIIVCCICRQRYRHEKPEDEMELERMSNPSQKRQENNYVGVVNPMILQAEKVFDKSYSELFLERLPQNVSELVASSIIDKSHVEIGHICTVKGTYTRIINGKYASSSSTPYAGDGNTIKTLVENYPAQGELPKWLSQGLQECTKLRDVVHDKVLRLRGIAIDEKKIYVVYPAMERTLKDYIQKNHGSQVINVDDVIAFCFDVGEGMKELHRQGIVHKDLAARNCMIDSGKVVKVADASFASDLYPEEYMKQLNRDLPVRWMAVESLQQTGFYDKATDMWSYGVLLWEVFTGCHYLPYQDLLDNDIHLNVVMRGYRLGKPENIPKPYLDILDQCMSTDNNLRPTFEAVLSLMNNALENPGEALYQNQEENYVNKTAIDHYMNKSAIDQSIQSDLPAPPPRKRIA